MASIPKLFLQVNVNGPVFLRLEPFANSALPVQRKSPSPTLPLKPQLATHSLEMLNTL